MSLMLQSVAPLHSIRQIKDARKSKTGYHQNKTLEGRKRKILLLFSAAEAINNRERTIEDKTFE